MISSIPREKKLAQKILKKYSLTPPINIREILEKYAKCVEDVLPNDADAICIMNTDDSLVVLNRFKSVTRKRFTLAHELGHLIIPWHSGMISCHTDQDVNQTAYQIMESEANSFAAEILMPTEWLKEIVKEEKSKSLDELVDIVANSANVSRSAAFFSLINHLPTGFVFKIQNYELGFKSTKRSPCTKTIIPVQNYEWDFQWLDQIAYQKDVFNLDSIIVEWWKLPDPLSEVEINKIIKKTEELDLTEVFNRIEELRKYSFISTITQFIDLLPSGYLMDFRRGDFRRILKSPHTNVGIPQFNSAKEEIAWFHQHSYKYGHFEFHGYSYFWGYFVVNTPQPHKIQDRRLSKDILRKILVDSIKEESFRTKYTHKINGIVGNLNNNAPNNFEEFYRLFKERFIGVEIFKEIVNHPEFDIFVVNKIKELLAKRR